MEHCQFNDCLKNGIILSNGKNYCQRHYILNNKEKYPNVDDIKCNFLYCTKSGFIFIYDDFYCKEHYKIINKPDKYYKNINSKQQKKENECVQFCNYLNCKKTKKLDKVFNGYFCKKHKPIMFNIRNNLTNAKHEKNIITEKKYRYEEILLRKYIDDNHVNFYNTLND